MDPKVVDALVASNARAENSPLNELTPRERDVLREMAEGKNNAAIAEALVLTERSVEKVIHSIFLKLGLSWEAAIHKRVKAVVLVPRREQLARAGQRAGDANAAAGLGADRQRAAERLARGREARRAAPPTGSAPRTTSNTSAPASSPHGDRGRRVAGLRERLEPAGVHRVQDLGRTSSSRRRPRPRPRRQRSPRRREARRRGRARAAAGRSAARGARPRRWPPARRGRSPRGAPSPRRGRSRARIARAEASSRAPPGAAARRRVAPARCCGGRRRRRRTSRARDARSSASSACRRSISS